MERFGPQDQQEDVNDMTGKEMESKVLGHVDVGWEADAFIEARKSGDRAQADRIVRDWLVAHEVVSPVDGKIPAGEELKKQLIEYVKNHDPEWDPHDPLGTSRFASNLHTLVAEHLGESGYQDLEFFRAADTPLDTLFGVDAFFEFKGRVLTVDITRNPHKQAHKADIVLQGKDIYDEVALDTVARDIAETLKRPIVRLAS